MNAPILWIFIPLIVAGLLFLLRNENAITLAACLFTLFLALFAWLIPIDSSLTLGTLTFNLTSSQEILGRHLTLTSADRSFLVLIYGSSLFWFIPAASLHIARRLIPIGLAVTAFLVAALAVEPFLYAALLIETAVLLSVPLMATPGQVPGKGLLRFLIFQTLAIPFILFSGWILAGIEANPGNLSMIKQAAIFLGLGFAFLLAVFPFYTWIPLLAEEVHPYILGFLLWILPTATLFFGLGFIDRYTWLRDTPALGTILTVAGALMVTTGGLLAVFQQKLSRIMGYAVIIETGFSLLALSLVSRMGVTIFLLLLVPRMLSLAVWALGLSVLKDHAPGLSLAEIKGFARLWPFAVTGIILANFSLAGVPLLAGFPSHQVVWEELARTSLPLSLWVFLGSLCLGASAIRVLTSISRAPDGTTWAAGESAFQRTLMITGWLALLILGLFPQWVLSLWSRLPPIFEHLGQ